MKSSYGLAGGTVGGAVEEAGAAEVLGVLGARGHSRGAQGRLEPFVAEAAGQPLAEGRDPGAHAGLGHRDRHVEVACPLEQGLQYRPAADAHDVGGQARELDVRFRQGLLQPLRGRGPRHGQQCPQAGELTQATDRPRWHERGADQAAFDDLGDPMGVFHVGTVLLAHGLGSRPGGRTSLDGHPPISTRSGWRCQAIGLLPPPVTERWRLFRRPAHGQSRASSR